MNHETRISDEFSAREFARRGLDSEEAATLALELEQAISKQLFVTLKQATLAIVRQLNEQGHSLLPDMEQVGDPLLPIGISFRDEAPDASETPRCKLRLAFDLTVSAGYAHLRYDLDDRLDEARERFAMRRK